MNHVAALPDERASVNPDGPCLADSSHELDNAGFARAVHRTAARLVELGIGPGDVVGVILPNCVELITIMFAAWRLGAALTPVNPALTAHEAEYQIKDSGASLVVVGGASAPKADGGTARVRTVDELTQGAVTGGLPPLRTDLADTALLIYTSGTTGRPKGVILDHSNVASTSSMIVDWFGMSSADRCLLVLPLFHVNGIMVSVVSPLVAGGSTVIAPRFDVDAFWELVERVRPTFFSAVPTIYALLTALPAEVEPDTSSLRHVICGAAPMPAGAIWDFEARYRVPVVEGYGLSESTVVITANPPHGIRKPGTVGLPLPGQQIRILGPHDEELPEGEPGEVAVRGENVMRGYLGQPDATANTLRGGWLHTGDVGLLDPDGYLVLVDRVKDMIIRGGENIYPKEIEDVLYTHPAVFEVAVVARGNAVFGEEPVAFVSFRAGREVEPEELIEYAKQSLAKFKVPREIFIEASLPKNAVGKIDKPSLRKRLSTATADVG
jgi:long-chain acyl-CoA synthetase